MSRCNFSTYQCILIQTTLILCILLLSIADKFGDISKKVVSSSTKGVEEVVKKVTKNEEYHFLGNMGRHGIIENLGSEGAGCFLKAIYQEKFHRVPPRSKPIDMALRKWPAPNELVFHA